MCADGKGSSAERDDLAGRAAVPELVRQIGASGSRDSIVAGGFGNEWRVSMSLLLTGRC